VGPALIISVMLVAIVSVHWSKGFWNMAGGYEFPLVNAAAALVLALIGPGIYALDRALNLSLPTPGTQLAALVMALLGTGVALVTTRSLTVGRKPQTA
jgi:putative oxidoreductase